MKIWAFGVIATLLLAAAVAGEALNECTETIINGKKITCCCVGDSCWCK